MQELIDWTGYCATYTDYFEEPRIINYSDSPDPLKRFESPKYSPCIYYKYPAVNICWMVDNIYNVEPEIVYNFDPERYEFNSISPYYYEGYYYFFFPPCGDGGLELRVAKEGRKKLKDGRYNVKIERETHYDLDLESYEHTIDASNKEKEFEIIEETTIGLKLIDEKRYWSLYEYKSYE